MAKKRYLVIQFFAVLFCLHIFPGKAKSQAPSGLRNYLSSALKKSHFVLSEKTLNTWRKNQKETYLAKIHALPDSVKEHFIAKADKAILFNWPAMPASLYLEFKQNGNRINYETKLTGRRNNLNSLVIGELITRNGKYLPQLVNGLWATLEESTWEIPAIIVSQKAGADLPDPSEEVIGLVSAETAVMIATIQYMLYDQLQAYSAIINKRIDLELHKRILNPYLQRKDFWWMGFKGNAVNNWNAWINTNVFQTALLSEKKMEPLSELVTKIFQSADNFVNQYPEDGGCDEGPTYWNIAGGKLIRLLQLSDDVSGGILNWRSNRLLHNIGSYIYKMHIANDYFVNFADATPRTFPSPESVYRFGKIFHDDSLKQFASYLFSTEKDRIPDNNLADFLATVDVFDQLTTGEPVAVLPAVSYLKDLQVLTVRHKAGSDRGLFLAVQGGNNGESHNHNDVGNFLIYHNGKPVIIDAGVGTYTKQTFSDRRYELWNMQSQWHNCPLVNGIMQKDGKMFRAKDVAYRQLKTGVDFSMDLSGAYPAEAFVKKWSRRFLFDQQTDHISISENYLLGKRTGETKINFLSSCEIKIRKAGEIHFCDPDGTIELVLKYDPEKLTASVEEKILSDQKLVDSWGKKLFRLSLMIDNTILSGEHKLEFSTLGAD